MESINIVKEKTKCVKRGLHDLDRKKLLRKSGHTRKANIIDSSPSSSCEVSYSHSELISFFNIVSGTGRK
jgi:hypothetical protein